jgi:hypothetical protein
MGSPGRSHHSVSAQLLLRSSEKADQDVRRAQPASASSTRAMFHLS